ncbi:hypothetical protein JK358_12595 [Nocardia sp. 2]|uniref:Uncharacterized protein n=1 Tax=Nocardia acididurans TaxID=2802282 RepID=A0ABS1M3K5_9NOCA|nr:hypothetical protein [Nocardia acididurans]MBL1075232.1 hypothetical protein [Nocardia acididurans]
MTVDFQLLEPVGDVIGIRIIDTVTELAQHNFQTIPSAEAGESVGRFDLNRLVVVGEKFGQAAEGIGRRQPSTERHRRSLPGRPVRRARIGKGAWQIHGLPTCSSVVSIGPLGR